ncbi:MAG TPA: hypothetical protein P5312_05125 [Bacteroidales bacterium]|jgi:hypothetical protein|nr:hypothetical protein [Bacteroidales bacterium]HOL97052.1 hypothetical protein [Bacteroidales bacterium]HOM35961.1 hypothetical protein [Bacteroidales bacterium]HPD23425.1 hypothetical protein [Bacteroidales bacterium]HRS99407.1 hypothetical protein [Bacteroidales bacterium]
MESFENNENIFNKLREIAAKNPYSIKIIETNVDPDTQIEFFKLIQKFGNQNIKISPEKLESQLINETNHQKIKELLSQLTLSGTVEAYRIIEKYVESAPEDLKKWAFLAYKQSKMFLESSLLEEESVIYIASGLGGLGHRLRYFFALVGKSILTDGQIKLAKGEVEYFLKKHDAIIEEINTSGKFIFFKALIPVQIEVITIMQEIVSEINQYGDFLNENVFITNEKIPELSELNNIFKDE